MSPLDLRNRASDPNRIKARRPELEIGGAAVGSAVGGDSIFSSTVKIMRPIESNIRPIWCSLTWPSPKSFQTPKQMFPFVGGINAFSNSVPSACQVLKDSRNGKGAGGRMEAPDSDSCSVIQVPQTNDGSMSVPIFVLLMFVAERADEGN
jgi:hypothetical protein